jgi:hypothetical protein
VGLVDLQVWANVVVCQWPKRAESFAWQNLTSLGRNSLERFARSLQHKPLSANTAPSRPKQNEHDQ